MGLKEDQRRKRRRRVFKRDGWQDEYGSWFVMCALGCGEVLSWHTASLDLYPVRKADGGRYTFDNTRLVCRPCRTRAAQEDAAARREVDA